MVAVIGVSAAIGGVKGIIDSAPDINVDDIAPDGFKSYMYLQDGKHIPLAQRRVAEIKKLYLAFQMEE